MTIVSIMAFSRHDQVDQLYYWDPYLVFAIQSCHGRELGQGYGSLVIEESIMNDCTK